MFDIALFIALGVLLVILGVIYTTVWRTYRRERATAKRVAGDTKRAGRHRAEDRPTMTWRG